MPDGELLRDYQAHAEFLAGLRGRVLDLGGAAGLAAAYLRPDVEYAVVDPSPIWSSNRWKQLAAISRASGPAPQFLEARAEEIACPDGSFDAAVSFWALNHVRDPQRCIQELARVLRPEADVSRAGRHAAKLDGTPARRSQSDRGTAYRSMAPGRCAATAQQGNRSQTYRRVAATV